MVSKVSKFSVAYVAIPTAEINTTALYSSNKNNIHTETFKTQYYTQKNNRLQQKDTREFQEVISQSVKSLGLNIYYVTVKGVNYSIIYSKNFKTDNNDETLNHTKQIQEFCRKYQRHPGTQYKSGVIGKNKDWFVNLV